MAKLIINLGKGGSADIENADGSLTPVDLPVGDDKGKSLEDLMEGPSADDLEAEKAETPEEEAAETPEEEAEEKADGTEIPPSKKPSVAVAVGIKSAPKKKSPFSLNF